MHFHPFLYQDSITENETSQWEYHVNECGKYEEDNINLIGIIGVKKQHINLITNIQLPAYGRSSTQEKVCFCEQKISNQNKGYTCQCSQKYEQTPQQQKIVAYLSETFFVKEKGYKIFYMPSPQSSNEASLSAGNRHPNSNLNNNHTWILSILLNFTSSIIVDISTRNYLQRNYLPDAIPSNHSHPLNLFTNHHHNIHQYAAITTNQQTELYSIKSTQSSQYNSKIEIMGKLRAKSLEEVIHSDVIAGHSEVIGEHVSKRKNNETSHKDKCECNEEHFFINNEEQLLTNNEEKQMKEEKPQTARSNYSQARSNCSYQQSNCSLPIENNFTKINHRKHAKINKRSQHSAFIGVNLKELEHCLTFELSKWKRMLNKSNSSQLSMIVMMKYKIWMHLKQQCIKYKQMSNNNKMLSDIEIEIIQQELIKQYSHGHHKPSIQHHHSSSNSNNNCDIHQIINETVQEIKLENKRYQVVDYLLQQLQQHFTSDLINSNQELIIKKETISHLLSLYSLPEFYVTNVTFLQEKSMLLKQIHQLEHQHQIHLDCIKQRDTQIAKKQILLQQYKLEIDEYTKKYVQLKDVSYQLQLMSQNLQKQKATQKKLQIQLDSQLLLDRKNNQIKHQTELIIKNLNQQKNSLFDGIKMLSQENMELLDCQAEMREEIDILKAEIQQMRNLENRALKSIENEAEVQNRLRRYEVYVHEIKDSIKLFKKMEISKFNYALEANYQEFEKVESALHCKEQQLEKSRQQIRKLEEQMVRDKMRLSYFEKIVMNHFDGETIDELSEEDIVTDRNIEQEKNQLSEIVN